MHRLKQVRVVTGWIVLGAFTLVFMLGTTVPASWASALAGTQLVPSLLRLLLGGVSLLAGVAIAILLLTLLFGRIYCASLCPLGVLQDLISFFSRKLRHKRRPWKSLPARQGLRYGLFTALAGSAILGSMWSLNLLDPYSLFGRLVTDGLRPLFIVLNNALVYLLESLDVFALSRRNQLQIPLGVLLTVGTLGALLVVFAARWGRLWCNLLCPVGALLGLLSRHSLWRIQLAPHACSSCGACAKSCRAGCIDTDTRQVDLSRCVACFDCLDVCPSQALAYQSILSSASITAPPDPERRHLLIGSAVLLGSAVPVRLIGGNLLAAAPQGTPICPPGAGDAARFGSLCTGCQLCVTGCPERAIQPAFLQFGLQALMQPTLNYQVGYCSYECNTCGQICPTGAIAPLTLPVKKRLQIGQAELNKDICVVYADHKECGACIEVCPTHAVYSVEREGTLYPEMDKGPCIGCGHCQLVCPKKTPPAILVRGNEDQTEAAPPNYDRIAPSLLPPSAEPTGQDGFPF